MVIITVCSWTGKPRGSFRIKNGSYNTRPINERNVSSRGDRPKTQKSILKVEDSIQYTTIERDNVVPENNLVIHSNVKVENDDQSKLVFRQPEGG